MSTPVKMDNKQSGVLRLSAMIVLMFVDILTIGISYFAALWLRFDCQFSEIPEYFLEGGIKSFVIMVALTVGIFWALHLYSSVWRFASYPEMFRILIGCASATVLYALITSLLIQRMPISYYIVGFVFQLAMQLAVRFSHRALLWVQSTIAGIQENASGSRIMLIGAGNAGQLILRDIKREPQKAGVVKCIIDDDPIKWKRFFGGVLVEGGRDEILSCVKKYNINKIFLAIPSATAEQKRDILNICKETNCELKNLPSIYQLCNGDVSVSKMRDVSVEDLLGRDTVQVNMEQIFQYLTGKVVLITGAAGSIGSELCRQIAQRNPKQMVLFDVYENTTYELELELKNKFPGLNLVTLIGSVRDSRRLEQVFGTYKPEIVFHAAAHKHVPLMEGSPCESIKNNTIGTYKTAYAAMRHGCRRFVLISTDKAVNPTNIMGASKRLCEMVVQSMDQKIKGGCVDQIPNLFTHGTCDGDREANTLPADVKTEFVAVRFGNVLGSNGSVIPLFKRQIETGGPVTVTHPDIIRYFMTIPEAVSLVLQAAVYAAGGEIFVLDMGEAVKIDTLARNLILLSGFRPDVDIKIQYTGLRPGEKLYEEKLMAEEGLRKTPNNLIHIGAPIPFDTDLFLKNLEALMDAAYSNDDQIRDMVSGIVATYHPAGEHGSEEKGEAYEKQLKQMCKA